MYPNEYTCFTILPRVNLTSNTQKVVYKKSNCENTTGNRQKICIKYIKGIYNILLK